MSDNFLLNGKEYVFLKEISRGNVGSVHLVNDLDGESYAVKISIGEDIEEMILDEVLEMKNIDKYLKSIKHPNLVHYYDSGFIANHKLPEKMRNSVGENISFILEEYVSGETLDFRMINTSDKKLKFLQDILSALLTLKNMGLLYNDLHYRNIIYNGENFVLVDFGDLTHLKSDNDSEESERSIHFLMNLIWKSGDYIYYDTCKKEIMNINNKKVLFDLNLPYDNLIQYVLKNNLSIKNTIIYLSKLFPETEIKINLGEIIQVYLNAILINNIEV